MSALIGNITPELRAALEPPMAKLAAPGMCNPADEHPCVKGTPIEEQIRSDNRTPEQRYHDALLAICRMVLCSEDLGQLNGLPVTVIVTTTLAEMQASAGCHEPNAGDSAAQPPVPAHGEPAAAAPAPHTGKALTAGGALPPMSDLVWMASHAIHYLTIFDGKGRALWLGRAKRIASADQRIVLHARDHGCTRPGCTVSGYRAQAHHLEHDWAADGQTDVDTLGLACPADNRMASQQGWVTRLGDSGRVEWIPPPELERGQPRVNPYHFIEDLVDYRSRRAESDATRCDEPPPPNQDRPWLDDPLPGDPGYDDALDSLHRAHESAPYPPDTRDTPREDART